tara:strand:+ start:119 stop:787 length:669 start_codon:yes stop_codon:yes gene_type:complete
MSDLIPDLVLQDNTSQRLPCVVVLDGSTSMSGDAITNLNAGLKVLEKELKSDDIASMRVQLLIIRIGGFSDAEIIVDWTDAIDFEAPNIEANGTTPLGKGVDLALSEIEKQKLKYRENQIPYNRPWLFVITDGSPTDNGWEKSAQKACEAEKKDKVVIFTIGTDGANFENLNRFSSRGALMLKNLDFKELFIWLSQSVSVGSQTELNSGAQLPAASWGVIPT